VNPTKKAQVKAQWKVVEDAERAAHAAREAAKEKIKLLKQKGNLNPAEKDELLMALLAQQ
jgi:hypothetical protein